MQQEAISSRQAWSSAPSQRRREVAYKAHSLRQFKHYLQQRRIQAIIPHKRNQTRGRPHNAALYRGYNIAEHFFDRLFARLPPVTTSEQLSIGDRAVPFVLCW
jgi:hypothetical protein